MKYTVNRTQNQTARLSLERRNGSVRSQYAATLLRCQSRFHKLHGRKHRISVRLMRRDVQLGMDQNQPSLTLHDEAVAVPSPLKVYDVIEQRRHRHVNGRGAVKGRQASVGVVVNWDGVCQNKTCANKYVSETHVKGVWRMRWSLYTLYLPACQVIVTVGDSGLRLWGVINSLRDSTQVL